MYLTGKRTATNFTLLILSLSLSLCFSLCEVLSIHNCFRQVSACIVSLAGLLCVSLCTLFS